VLVVRDGNGCSAYSRVRRIDVIAYHYPDQESQPKVVNPMGRGNAFLEALAMALSGDACSLVTQVSHMLAPDKSPTWRPSHNLTIPLVYATIVASFVIEQPGMPTYHMHVNEGET
jgi:sugar/nucleoside kinase (ribokinase family)